MRVRGHRVTASTPMPTARPHSGSKALLEGLIRGSAPPRAYRSRTPRLSETRPAGPFAAGGPKSVLVLQDSILEVQEARLRAASHAFRSLRRSSSEVPPQMPD